MLKTYQRQTKLFKLLRDTNREDKKIRKKRRQYNSLVAKVFASLVRLCLQAKLPSFFTTGYTRKYQPISISCKKGAIALFSESIPKAMNIKSLKKQEASQRCSHLH